MKFSHSTILCDVLRMRVFSEKSITSFIYPKQSRFNWSDCWFLSIGVLDLKLNFEWLNYAAKIIHFCSTHLNASRRPVWCHMMVRVLHDTNYHCIVLSKKSGLQQTNGWAKSCMLADMTHLKTQTDSGHHAFTMIRICLSAATLWASNHCSS